MNRLVKSASCALALTATTLFAQSPASDAILGALRIGSLNDLASSAGEFANHIRPGSGAATAQLTAGAAAFGIDPAAEILVLVIDPQKTAVPFAFVLPAANPETIKTNPALGFKPAARPDRYQITLGGRPMFATFVGKRLLVSPLETGLDAVLPVIESGEDIRQLRATGGQLALSLSADRLYAAYKPMLDIMLLGMRGQLAKAAPANGAPPANPADILASLLSSVADLQTVSLRIAIQPDHLEFRSLVDAKPGSSTAILLSPGRGPAVTTLGLHDPASAVLGTVSAKPGPEFWQAYNEMVAKLLSASGTPGAAKTSQTLAKVVNDFAAIWGGGASFGMLGKGEGLSGSGVASITDSARTLALIQSMPELQKSMAELNTGQGISAEPVLSAVETYHGASLLDFTQTYQALNPAATEGLNAMKKLGLDRMTVTYAVTSDRVLYTMGANARENTKRLVDTTGSALAPVSPAAYGLPTNTTLFAVMSLPRYFAWIARAGALPIPVPAVADDQKPGLIMTADLDAGRADLRMHLAASEIAALIGMFTPPPPAPAVAPAPAATATR